MNKRSVDTPLGAIVLAERDGQLVMLAWSDRAHADRTPALDQAAAQLDAYFAGELRQFDLPLFPQGGRFQRQVCNAMSAIPYGETRTYGEIALNLGSAAQPVGQACGGNSIPIIVPCHRVLAANGLGGYSGRGGLETKIALLKHEGAFPYLL